MGADIEVVRRLARADWGLAVVATTRPDGSVHTSVVNAGVFEGGWGGEPPPAGAGPTLDSGPTGPTVAFVVRGNARKLAHFRRSGRAAVVFRSGWEWVSVEGPVRIVDASVAGDGLPGLLRAVFVAAGGTHDNWDEYDRVMAAEGRVAVLVTPARITGNG